jgi:hypothetical protein
MNLKIEGHTALGPGVLASIGLASEFAPGSNVIVCTDGLANVGLGSLSNAKNEVQLREIEKFYD